MRQPGRYLRENPLESSVCCYVLLTIVPGVFWGAEEQYAAEAVFRYLLPGAGACVIAARCYGASPGMLGCKGFGKSVLYGCSMALLCLANLISGGGLEPVQPDWALWIFCCALGEELLGRMLLLSGIASGARGRGWGEGRIVALSAALFGLMHAVNGAVLGPAGAFFQCCYTAGIGWLLAWSCRKSGCLWGGVLWHALLNLSGLPPR